MSSRLENMLPPREPMPEPEGSSKVVRNGAGPPVSLQRTDLPTHAIWRDEGVELVFPEGYDPANLTPLPKGFHDRPMKADLKARRFDPDVEAGRTAKKAEIETRAAQAFLAGYSPGVGALEGQRLQVRDVEDRTNWLTSQAAYAAAVAGGFGAQPGARFRTASNATIVTSFAEGLDVLLGMAEWGASIMACAWSLKDQIEAAEQLAGGAALEAIMAIDVEAQPWPA